MRKRRVLVAIVVLLLLGGIATILWTALDWPPPRLILKYGLPPTGGPTGNVRVIEGIEFVELGPGYFRMRSHRGCQKGDLLGRLGKTFGFRWGSRPRHGGNECPVHWVEISHRLWFARTEVTNAQYERVMASHARSKATPDDDHPAVSVSWHDACEFCARLSVRHGCSFRLPTESEWEWACRARSTLTPATLAWVERGPPPTPRLTVQRSPSNERGLQGMCDATMEWCEDCYTHGYAHTPCDGGALVWPEAGLRVVRGLDPARRGWGWEPGTRRASIGFRPVFTLPEEE